MQIPNLSMLLRTVAPAIATVGGVALVATIYPSLPTANPYAAKGARNNGGQVANTGPGGIGSSPTPGAPGSPTPGVTRGAPSTTVGGPVGSGTGGTGGSGSGGNAGGTNGACPNGGATYQGVTCDSILTAFHWQTNPCGQDISGALAAIGVGKGDPAAALNLLVPYINTHLDDIFPDARQFNHGKGFYGRSIVQKNQTDDGGTFCPATNQSTAVQAAQGDKVFAGVGGCINCNNEGSSQVWGPVLSSYHLIDVEPTQNRDSWYRSMAPYVWTILPTGDTIINQWADFVCNYAKNKSPVVNSDDPLFAQHPRVFSVSHVDQPEEDALGSALIARIKACGAQFGAEFAYAKDLSTAAAQAAQYTQAMRAAHTTTVLDMSDAVATLIGSTSDASNGWHHETIISGYGYLDTDGVTESYPADWQYAFGTAQNNARLQSTVPFCSAFWYTKVWCQANPGVNPAADFPIWGSVLEVYARMLLTAGPNLSPQTIKQGMWSNCHMCLRANGDTTAALYAGGTAYTDGEYGGLKDYALVHWDPNQHSDYADKTTTNKGKGGYMPIGLFPGFEDLKPAGWTRFRSFNHPG